MVFEHIRKLQQEYSDKFVVVDEQRPELRRFQGLTGSVKTVNLSGMALVEFAGNPNIGWYDIDIDYLKVIDQPLAAEKSAEQADPAVKTESKSAPKSEAQKLPKTESETATKRQPEKRIAEGLQNRSGKHAEE